MERIVVQRKILDQTATFSYEPEGQHGIFLSGGLDSLAFLNWMSVDAPQLLKQLTAFTFKKENQESAIEIAKRYNLKNHQLVEAQAQQGAAARSVGIENPQIKLFYAAVTANPTIKLNFQGEEAKRGDRPNKRLQMPFVNLDKRYTVQLALDLKAPIVLSHTCTSLEKEHCGRCFMCSERRWAFGELKVTDPAKYVA